MTLMSPGPGDLLDRLTILARKIVERPERQDFKKEYAEIRERLTGTFAISQITTLAALNAAIWQREDEIRRERAAKGAGRTLSEIVTLAFEIQTLNDQRAALIAELNGIEGEKLYEKNEPITTLGLGGKK